MYLTISPKPIIVNEYIKNWATRMSIFDVMVSVCLKDSIPKKMAAARDAAAINDLGFIIFCRVAILPE